MWARFGVIVGITACAMLANAYYDPTAVFLKHIKELSEEGIPAVLSIELLWEVVKRTSNKNKK